MNKDRILSICCTALCICTLTSTIVLTKKVNKLSTDIRLSAHSIESKLNFTKQDIRSIKRNFDNFSVKNATDNNIDENTKEVMSISELSEYLNIPIAKLYEFLEEIPHIQIEKEYRFSKSATNEWLKSSNFKFTKELMTPGELATYLCVNINEVYNLIDDPNSNLPYTKNNDHYIFHKSKIDEWKKTRNTTN